MLQLAALSSPRPDILYVVRTLQVGGSERHLLHVATALTARGWRISLFSLDGEGPLRAEFARAGVEVVGRSPTRLSGGLLSPGSIARLTASAAALFGLMLRRRPAIVHFFLPAPYLIGAPLAILAGIRLRVMSRRSLNDYQIGHPLLTRMEAMLHSRMSALLGNSRAVVRQLAEEGAAQSRLVLIYNGIDTTPFGGQGRRAQIRAELGVGTGALLFICVANLIAYKGHSDLIAAFAAARDRLPPPWRLLIVGRDDGVGSALREQAAALGLSENILFLGARDDIPELLLASQIGVLGSHQEGFSNAILEMMAAGLPMIATSVGGNPEAVIDGETGILVPPRQPDLMAAAIVRLASDAQLRASYGRAARQHIAEHFALSRCIEAYEGLYRALLTNGPPVNLMEMQGRCRPTILA